MNAPPSRAAGAIAALKPYLLLLALLLASPRLATAAEAVQPSFSCTGATRTVERMICTHATLARADRELDELYKNATGPRASDGERTALRDEQRAWLKQRDRQCIGGMTIEQATRGLQPLGCLRDAYGERIRALRDVVSPPLIPTVVTAVDTAALDTAATPAGQRSFRDGAFSADGRTLAVYVVYRNDESARQVWMRDAATGELVAATPRLGNANPNSEAAVSSDIELAWDGDTLYVHSEDEGEDGGGVSSMHAATVRNGPSRLATVPARVEGLFERSRWYRPSPEDLDGVADDGMLGDGVFALGDYLVWLSDQARGNLVLRMAQRGGVRMPVQDIVHGSWELASIEFDRTHLIYPSRDGLMLFDLGRRKARRIAGTAVGDLPVAYEPRSHMLAWAGTQPCGRGGAGSEAGFDPGAPHPYLCIASLPAF